MGGTEENLFERRSMLLLDFFIQKFYLLSPMSLKFQIKGWFRGGVASIPRAFVASTSQLTSFYYVKEYLDNYAYVRERPLLKSFLASMVGGVAISVCVTPFDLVLTRLYNQGIKSFYF